MDLSDIPQERIPRHVAIIMDGNGRWAAKKGLPRTAGHKAGADNVENIADACIEAGVAYMTVYAFSTENWKRSTDEVSYLMSLMGWYLNNYVKTALRKGMRLKFIGRKDRLNKTLRDLMDRTEKQTSSMDKLTLTFAIDYGGRDEMARAVRKIAKNVQEGKLTPEAVDEGVISENLDTFFLPDPDLVIRTSGEERISNFLLWQMAYSELVFTSKYWPDFSGSDLEAAIREYASRDRRFGGRKS